MHICLYLHNGAHERSWTADLTLTKGVLYQLSYMSETLQTQLERVARIELASSAWKAEVLPLNYTRTAFAQNLVEGEGFEPSKLTRQIYSLIPLAARESLHK